MRVAGRISPRKAAAMLGVHYNTVVDWCKRAVDGNPTMLNDVRQFANGYYWIDADEVRTLRRALKNESVTRQ